MLRVLLSKAPPPHEAHARLAARHATTYLLESRTGPGRLARYSLVGWDPAGTVRLDDDGLQVTGQIARPTAGEAPLDFLRRLRRMHHTSDHEQPFVGGLVGSLGADLAKTFEPSLEHGTHGARDRVPGERTWPRLLLGLYLDALVYDHRKGTVHYVTVGPDRRADLEALARPAAAVPLRVGPARASHGRAAFTGRVRRAQRLIRAGECFQIVLSRSYRARFRGDLGACYGWVREHADAPYLFFLRFAAGGDADGPHGARVLLGASPETLVRVRKGRAATFPIAGTRPLTGRKATDAAAARDLLADAKENAEHAMLVDLARNDLARVGRPGSVKVTQYRKVEPFGTVQHLVSEVQGDLRPGQDALDALAAVFPAGTVSGAPKVRALEHIGQLEKRARGAYAGAVAYLSFNGDLDSCIAIRCLSAIGDELTVQAGAGIVLDSRPDSEFDETRHKARLLLGAIGRFGARLPKES